jgi:hypothetical protein
MRVNLALFLLNRVYGLAQVVDGVVCFFSPFRPRLTLHTARCMARIRF